MDLDSGSIQKKEFHIVFKGYKPEEVDKFLDLLASEFDRLQKKNKELQENIDNVRYEGDDETLNMKKVIQDAIVSAHRVAEEIKEKAKREAEKLVNRKKLEEEEIFRKMLEEKESLQREIKRLKEEYDDFRGQVLKFADDFKTRALKPEGEDGIEKIPGQGEFKGAGFGNDTWSVTGDDSKKETCSSLENHEVPPDKEKTSTKEFFLEKETPGSKEAPVEKDTLTAGKVTENEDMRLYKHVKREYGESGYEENIGSKIPDSEFSLNGIDEKKKSRKFFPEEGSGENDGNADEEDLEEYVVEDQEVDVEENHEDEEEKQPGEGEKRNRKKIDIANPDIINDFFKTDD